MTGNFQTLLSVFFFWFKEDNRGKMLMVNDNNYLQLMKLEL